MSTLIWQSIDYIKDFEKTCYPGWTYMQSRFLIRRGRIWGHTPNMQCEEGEERDTAQPPEPKETRNEPSLTASGGSMVRSTLDYWTSGL